MENNNTNQVEVFAEVIEEIRPQAPAVGLAALSGKSPNFALRNSYQALADIGIQLEIGKINYRWHDLHEVNPKLAHSIEEVLVFGDALFTACRKRQTPEGLTKEYIELKDKFAKVLKDTQVISSPKEEKGLFSDLRQFMLPGSNDNKKSMELKLEQLDANLHDAHNRSRILLGKAETDLVEERAFHSATEWFVLALDIASKHLEELSESEDIDKVVVSNLQTAIKSASVTTNAMLSTTSKWLGLKESLHDRSISFLTSHENTFTVIQGQLRSWKDIQEQTNTLNALSETVKAGSGLMRTASIGVEDSFKEWNPSKSFVSPETVKALTNSFGQYDADINNLVSSLVDNESDSVGLSRWDDWETTRESILEPILAESVDSLQEKTSKLARPVLKTKQITQKDDEANENEEVWFTNNEDENKPSKNEKSLLQKYENEDIQLKSREFKPWSKVDNLQAKKYIDRYNKLLGSNFDIKRAIYNNWDVNETIFRLSAPIHALSSADVDISNLPMAIRSEIDYKVQYEFSESIDWLKIASQKVIPFDKNWKENFSEWMLAHDDLDWAYLMQWNDLVYDLMILDQDEDQQGAILTLRNSSENHEKIRDGLIKRINDFITDPGLTNEQLKTWGFTGLIVRYALALDIDPNEVKKLWKLFHNPEQPVDYDGQMVSEWMKKYPNQLTTESAQKVWQDFDMDKAKNRTSVAFNVNVDSSSDLQFQPDIPSEIFNQIFMDMQKIKNMTQKKRIRNKDKSLSMNQKRV